MQSVKLILLFAVATFVGLVLIAVLFTRTALTGDLLWGLALASLGTAAVMFGPFFLSWWAHDVKAEHEAKINDGSFRYRLSQIRYVVALLILGIVGLLVLYAVLHHRGRGGG